MNPDVVRHCTKRNVRYQKKRARKAESLLNTAYDDCDHFASVIDMLADLMHYCEVNKMDYSEAERIAEEHYLYEREKGDGE